VALGGGRIATAHTRVGDLETTIRVVDARTGALQWERPLPEGRRDASVLAADPVVVSIVSIVGPEDPASRRLHLMTADTEQAIDLPGCRTRGRRRSTYPRCTTLSVGTR
jgi:hypothetical protein